METPACLKKNQTSHSSRVFKVKRLIFTNRFLNCNECCVIWVNVKCDLFTLTELMHVSYLNLEQR